MQQISNTAPALTRAIQQGLPVEITASGTWRHKNVLLRIVALFRRLFFGYNEALENAENLTAFLSAPKMVSSDAIKGLSQKDSWDAKAIFSLVEAVKSSLAPAAEKEKRHVYSLINQRKQVLGTSPNEDRKIRLVELNRRIYSSKERPVQYAMAGLDRAFLTQRYLGENQETIESTEPKESNVHWLRKKVRRWLKYQYPELEYRPDSKEARATIRRACQYQDFISAARKNRALLELFLCSAFKHQSNIDVFIQAPRIQAELEKTFLYKRLQRSPNGGLQLRQVTSDGARPVKDITLLVHGKHQSIVDPKGMVEVADRVQWAVSKVFEECKAQNSRFIALEYLWQGGLEKFDGRLGDFSLDQENWWTHLLKYLWRSGPEKFDGRLGDFNLDQENWWTHLPTLFQPMTKEQILTEYGVALDDKENYALFVAKASRTTPDMNIKGCHGWCNIIFPSGDGTYTVIAPGKYADWFPNSFFEEGLHTFGTYRGQVTLTDFNEFMSNRERLSVPVSCLSKEEFSTAMEFLKERIKESREGNMVFQAQGDDCANFVQELSDHLWPGKFNLFDLSFEQLALPPALSWIVKIKPRFSTAEKWQRFRRAFCCTLGALRGHRMANKKVICLKDFKNWYDGHLALPAALWLHRDAILATNGLSAAV